MRNELLPALVAALWLAGCAGPGSGPPIASLSEATTAGAEIVLAVLSHETPGTVNVTRWSNGTFQAQDNCNLAGCVTGAGIHVHDLSDAFPAQVPVRFRVELVAPAPPLTGRQVFLELDTTDAAVYHLNEADDAPGVMTGTLLRGSGTVRAQVIYSSVEPPGATNVDYSLRLDVIGHPDWTPGGVPLLVELGPDVQAVAGAAGPLSATILDPAGAVTDRVSGSGELRLSSTISGPHVVVLSDDVETAQLRTTGPSDSFRALALDIRRGEAHAADPSAAVTWKFSVERPPIFVGVYAEAAEQVIVGAQPTPVEVKSSQGVALTADLACDGVCITGGYGQLARSTSLHPNLVEGEYEVRLGPAGVIGMQVSHIVAYDART